MPPKRRGVVSSARSRSNRDELHGAPFRLQTEQGMGRRGLDQFAELPLQSFQEELERHAVQNQFAGSLFPQQVELRQQDAPIRNIVNTDFNLRNPRRAVIDSFINVGNQAFEAQMQYAITKVEREIMSKRDFRKFLETDFVFSNVSPAIDVMTTMIGQEVVPAPTADEVKFIKERIQRLDPSLLTDTRALIKILKSPDLMYEVFKVGSAVASQAVMWYKYIVAMLKKISVDYGLPDPTAYFSSGGQPPQDPGVPPPPPTGAPTSAPNDFTAPPSTQAPTPYTTQTPALETQDSVDTGSATSTNVPPAPPPTQIVDPVAPPSMSGVVTRGTTAFAPPALPPLGARTAPPVVDNIVAPQYTQLFIGALQYALLPLATMYGGYVFIKRPEQIPPEPYEQEVEMTVMRRTITVAEYLIIHSTKTFFASNLVRYIVQTAGANYNTVVRLFNSWVEYLLMEEVDRIGAQEALFPNPQQIPAAQQGGVDVARLMRAEELRRGGDQPPRQDLLNALDTFIAEVDRLAGQMEQAVQGRQAQDAAVQQRQQQRAAAGGGIILRLPQVAELIRQWYADGATFQNGAMTMQGLVEALNIIVNRVMQVREPDLTDAAFRQHMRDELQRSTKDTGSSSTISARAALALVTLINGYTDAHPEALRKAAEMVSDTLPGNQGLNYFILRVVRALDDLANP